MHPYLCSNSRVVAKNPQQEVARNISNRAKFTGASHEIGGLYHIGLFEIPGHDTPSSRIRVILEKSYVL